MRKESVCLTGLNCSGLWWWARELQLGEDLLIKAMCMLTNQQRHKACVTMCTFICITQDNYDTCSVMTLTMIALIIRTLIICLLKFICFHIWVYCYIPHLLCKHPEYLPSVVEVCYHSSTEPRERYASKPIHDLLMDFAHLVLLHVLFSRWQLANWLFKHSLSENHCMVACWWYQHLHCK